MNCHWTKLLAGFYILSSATGVVVHHGHQREKRVVGGYDVPWPGYACSWPYIVIVEKTCIDVNHVIRQIPYRCAGSIIDKDFVLTSKQCVERYWPSCFYTEIQIIAGAGFYDYDQTEVNRQYREPRGGQGGARPGIIEHPDADIAIIEVDREFDLHNNVVDKIDMAEEHWPVGTECMGGGWGRNSWADPPTYPSRLQQVEIYIRYYKDDVVSLTTLRDGQHSGVYEGDSGGPVIYYRGHGCQRPEQVAVVNCRPRHQGGTCGVGTIVGEHTSVASYKDWVLNNTIYREDLTGPIDDYSDSAQAFSINKYILSAVVCIICIMYVGG